MKAEKKEHIVVLGAGLSGSLLALLLKKEGFRVSVFEKRQDPRKVDLEAGRSINLALSHRGLHALEYAGALEGLSEVLVPMKGRMMHDTAGNLTFQAYGTNGESINSVSRNGLNCKLIGQAESAGCVFHFGHRCLDVDLEKTEFVVADDKGNARVHKADRLIGSDGAYSVLRQKMQIRNRFNYQQHYIEHGYKELSMPSLNGGFAMDPNYLHIWPRGNFMLIALPNPDKSFTCTLFFPFEGNLSFHSIGSPTEIGNFFAEHFADVVPLIPDFQQQYQNNPTASLVTIRCFPWHYKKCLLIGDAAHAIVPFFGQGMNAAFEDCRILLETAKKREFQWDQVFQEFSETRKKDADAIADLALRNFVEMRDRVADEAFLERKKMDAKMHKVYGHKWIPLYTQVSFSDIPYSVARENGYRQEEALRKAQNAGKLDDPDYILEQLSVD